MTPNDSGDPYFPSDFAKAVIRRGQVEARRRRVLGTGAGLSALLVASLAWLLVHSPQRAQPPLIASVSAAHRPPRCPWGNDPPSEGERGSGDEAGASTGLEADPFR